MSKSDNKLNMDQMEQLNGGCVVSDDTQKKYWFVKPDGSTLSAPSEKKAKEFAKSYNTSPDVISREEYKERFGRDLD